MLHSPCLCLVLCMLAVCVHHVIVPRQRAMFLYILLMHLHSSEFTIKHTCIACYSLTEAMCSCVSVSQVNIHCFCIFTASHWCTFECSTLVIHSTRVASWRIGCEQVRSKFVSYFKKSTVLWRSSWRKAEYFPAVTIKTFVMFCDILLAAHATCSMRYINCVINITSCVH